MIETPDFLKDAGALLSDQGFTSSNVWYHGTASALVESIQQQGLLRSGDAAINAAAEQTMATIGNTYTATPEPVFLTQSSELAWYWAQQAVRRRSVRFGEHEQPVVFCVQLGDGQNAAVRPDVGAASLLLLEEGERYMAYLAGVYQAHGRGAPVIDLRGADRMEYLTTLGMAYLDADVEPDGLSVVAG